MVAGIELGDVRHAPRIGCRSPPCILWTRVCAVSGVCHEGSGALSAPLQQSCCFRVNLNAYAYSSLLLAQGLKNRKDTCLFSMAAYEN